MRATKLRDGGFLNRETGILDDWIPRTRKSSLTITATSNINCTDVVHTELHYCAFRSLQFGRAVNENGKSTTCIRNI